MTNATTPSAIVTGVSRGLGEALALALLERGYAVLGAGRTSSSRLAHPRYRFAACDFADLPAVVRVLEPEFTAIAAAGPAYVCLVNNAAAVEPVGVLGRLPIEGIEASLAVNLAAPVAIANLFCRIFADAATDRRIINVSSGAAQSPLPGSSLYGIAKAGLEMLTRSLAAEHASAGFHAITLRPGIIDTRMQTFMRTQNREQLPSVDLFRDFHASGRLVAPDVVAAKVVDRLVQAQVEQGRTYSYAEL